MKVNFTVLYTKMIPVEIEYQEGDTDEIIRSKCIAEAEKEFNNTPYKTEIVVTTTDHLKQLQRKYNIKKH